MLMNGKSCLIPILSAWRHVERSQRVSEDYKESAPVLDPKIILGNESNLNIVWTGKIGLILSCTYY